MSHEALKKCSDGKYCSQAEMHGWRPQAFNMTVNVAILEVATAETDTAENFGNVA